MLSITATSGYTQTDSILDNFTVYCSNVKVFLNWVIKSGQTCNGTEIFRSTDSLHFLKIGGIDGICGNSSAPVPYNFTDNNPTKNSVNYYRLELGNFGLSHIVSVEIIDFENRGFQVRPNPSSNITRIYFANDSKQFHQFFLYNSIGLYCTSLSLQADFIDLDVTHLPNGIYYFTLINSENLLKVNGKLTVLHEN